MGIERRDGIATRKWANRERSIHPPVRRLIGSDVNLPRPALVLDEASGYRGSAQQDRIVPARIQRQIIDAYHGPLKVLSMPGADHDTPLTEADLEQLRHLADWLYGVATAWAGQP